MQRSLLALSGDIGKPTQVRAEAIVALSSQPNLTARELLPFLADADPQIVVETLRALRAFAGDIPVREGPGVHRRRAEAAEGATKMRGGGGGPTSGQVR